MADATQTLLIRAHLEASKAIADLKRMEGALNANTTAAAKAGGGLAAAGRNARQYGAFVQNAGFQINDFVVQVTSGQSALVAFSQQFAQIAQFLGPWGMGLSIVVPAVIGLGRALYSAAEAGDTMSASLKQSREQAAEATNSIQELRLEIERLQKGWDPQQQSFINAIDAEKRAISALLDEYQRINTTILEGADALLMNIDDQIAEHQMLLTFYRVQLAIYNELVPQAEALRKKSEETKNILKDITGLDISGVFKTAETAADGLLAKTSQIYYTMLGMAARVRQEQLDAFGGEGDPYYSEPRTFTPPRIPSDSRGGGGSSKQIKEITERVITLNEWLSKTESNLNETFMKTGVNALFSFSDALIEGQLNFKDFTRNLLLDIAKLTARMLILNLLMKSFGFKSGGTELTTFGSILSQLAGVETQMKFAKGGVVNGPTVFPMASGKTGLMGEAGPEAIVPLTRRNGTLGVGASPVNLEIHNYSGQQVSVDRTEDTIRIAVGQAVAAAKAEFAHSMTTGQGTYARALELNYSSRRKLGG